MEQKLLKCCCNYVKEKYCKNFSIPENISLIPDLKLNNHATVKDTSTNNPKIYVANNLIKNCINRTTENKKINKDNILILMHVLHHELCHIELDKKAPILSKYCNKSIEITEDNIGSYLLCAFLQEYITCFLSCETITNPVAQANSKTFINIGQNLNSSKDYIKFVKESAYFLGETARQCQELRQYILDNIENLYIKDLLLDFNTIGENLAKKYKNISEIDIENNQYMFSTTYFIYK